MKWFCKHRWLVLDRVIIPAGVDKARDAGLTKVDHVSEDFFEEKHRTIINCEKCGKLQVVR